MRRLDPQNVLLFPRRQRILDVIKEHAGLSFRQLSLRSQVPYGTLRHHLNILQRAGLVIETQVKTNQLAFFPAGTAEEEQRRVLLQEPGLADVLETVERLAPCRQREVLDKIPQPRSTTQHRLQRLVDAGFIRVTRVGRSRFHTIPGNQYHESLSRMLEAL